MIVIKIYSHCKHTPTHTDTHRHTYTQTQKQPVDKNRSGRSSLVFLLLFLSAHPTAVKLTKTIAAFHQNLCHPQRSMPHTTTHASVGSSGRGNWICSFAIVCLIICFNFSIVRFIIRFNFLHSMFYGCALLISCWYWVRMPFGRYIQVCACLCAGLQKVGIAGTGNQQTASRRRFQKKVPFPKREMDAHVFYEGKGKGFRDENIWLQEIFISWPKHFCVYQEFTGNKCGFRGSRVLIKTQNIQGLRPYTPLMFRFSLPKALWGL